MELNVVRSHISRRFTTGRSGLPLVLIGLVGWAGCAGDAAPTASVEPSAAAQRAIEECDADSDGVLTLSECGATQGLQSVFSSYDSDGDGKLTTDEIEQGILNWSERPYPIAVEVRVVSGPRAIPNATVKLEPVAFLADNLPEAEGVTDGGGLARMHAPSFPFPESLQRERFMFPGLYNVRITVPNQKKPFPVLGAAVNSTLIASRALRIEVFGNGTATVKAN